jgi:hypothetical protein
MAKTIEELLADPELNPMIQAYGDKRVTEGIKKFVEKHPSADTVTQVLLDKVAKLEDGLQKKELKFLLDLHLFKKCTEAGIDPGLLDGIDFKTVEAIDKKIVQVTSLLNAEKQKAMDKVIAENSLKPGSGSASPSRVENKIKGVMEYAAEAAARDRK